MSNYVLQFRAFRQKRLREKIKKRVLESGLFDAAYYWSEYTDVKAAGYDPLDHYLDHGIREGRNPNFFFDALYYCSQTGPLENPVLHYLKTWKIKRHNTSPRFNTDYYLSSHPEILKSPLNPLQHYLFYGKNAGFAGAPVPAQSLPLNHQQVQSELDMLALEDFLSWKRVLTLPRADSPKVSIIMVLHNRAELTYHCLLSILQTDPFYEVILVDNFSTDRTHDLLHSIRNAIVLKNNSNDGFIQAANQGARAASGRYLLFLNNDTELLPGCLASAVTTLESGPSIGAVGGRVLNLDGTLQEAGSMIWKDGLTDGYGNNRKADAPEFMFRRDVDYCSGCFLLTPSDLFKTIGPFNPIYGFGYYEEADYCVRLKKAGYRIVYEPKATLLHHKHGSGTLKEATAISQRNQALFFKEHESFLDKFPLRNAGLMNLRRHGAVDKRRILFIDDRAPIPSLGSGLGRTNALIKALIREDVHLTYYPMCEGPLDWGDIYSFMPSTVEYLNYGSAEFLSFYLQENNGIYDDIIVSRPHNLANLLKTCGHLKLPKLIYDSEAFYAARIGLQHQLYPTPELSLQAGIMLKEEIRNATFAQAILAVSPSECALFKEKTKKPVFQVGMSLPIRKDPPPFEHRHGLFFVGSFHASDSPNYDSLVWIIEELWPLLKAAGLDSLKIAGYLAPGVQLPVLPDGMHYLGRVKDLQPLFDQSRVFIAPTRFAAGIPVKCLEAASAGLPIVANELLAGQLDWKEGEGLLAAKTNDAGDFCAKCVRLYHNPSLWQDVQEKGLKKVGSGYSQEVFQEQVHSLLGQTVPQRLRPRHEIKA